MEYKINEFNITDNKYTDLKGLITCFENSIPLSQVSFCNFGPNLMCVKATEKKNPKTKEDKKILREQANLILSSLNSKEKNDEYNFCFSMSNNINKIYLKRFLKQIEDLLHKNKNKDIDEGVEDVYEIMNFFELISFFTCIKDEYDDEIPLTDYSLTVSVDKNVKYNKINMIQFNSEYIFNNIINEFNKTNENIRINSKNNIHFFYMLLYNLQINELASYLYCEETKDYFSIFSEEETLDEHAKRFFFINQFKMLKNDKYYKFMTINSDEDKNKNVENVRYNKSAIKSEYEFYYNLYQNYLNIKKELLISEENEKKIFGIYFGILLLSEFDFIHDDLFINVIKRNVRELKSYDENNKSLTNIFSQLRNILISDIRFSSLGSNKKGGEKKKILNLLNKLAICLGISETKIFYILLTENTTNKELSFKEYIVNSEIGLFNNIIYFMNILYLKSIYNILDIISAYNKKQKLTITNNKPKKIINILLLRSNLVHNIIYENYLLSNNSYLTIGDNFIDSNSYVIKQNIKEHLYSNYFQEKKNYIYLKNSLSLNIDTSFPKMKENEEHINSVLKENINFEEILNAYENEICGLLKLINYGENNTSVHNFNIFDNKNNLNLKNFKVQFSKNISRKNKIEIIDAYNSIEQKNEIYIKVTHSFGVFLYDLNQLFNLDTGNKNIYNAIPNIYKEQNIFKFLEYQPNLNNSTSFKYFQEKTINLINSLSASKKPIYISCLIELNKFNTLTLFDDMKINTIYVYYSNYFNYLLNINDIRKQLLLYHPNFIPKYMKNKDNLSFFKFLTKKFKITKNDYTTDKINEKKEGYITITKYRSKERMKNNIIANYVFVKNNLSNAFEKDKNIALMIYKYNYHRFIQIFCEKISKSKFNYFIYAINGIKAFVKLTKIYKEKLVLSNVRNLITDIIVDNYDIIKEDEESESSKNPINQQLLPKIDNLDELIFDFNKEALGKMLPKLRSNLVQLKRIWKDYIYDIIYLINNDSIFYNKECAQLIIEQRMINFQILLFLFHKNYKFINSDSIMKFGVLLFQFTKTVSNEVLRLLAELKTEFDVFLVENNGINNNLNELNKNFEDITFEKLITKRFEIQNIINQKIKEKEKNFIKINQQKMREKNLENKNFNSNGAEETAIIGKNNKFIFEESLNEEFSRNKFKEFNISKKDLYEGRLDNNLRSNKSRKPSSRAIESFNTVNRNSHNLLQLTHGNSSISIDEPNTELNNNNQSSEPDGRNINNKMNNYNNNVSNKNSNNNVTKHKYKYSNISLKKNEENNKTIKSKENKINYNINENNSCREHNFSNILENNLNNINKKKNSSQNKEIKSTAPIINNKNENNINNHQMNENLINGDVLKKGEKINLKSIKIDNEFKNENEKENINSSNNELNTDNNINNEENQKNEIKNDKNLIINISGNNTNQKNNKNLKINNNLDDDIKNNNYDQNEINNKSNNINKFKEHIKQINLNESDLANIDTQGNIKDSQEKKGIEDKIQKGNQLNKKNINIKNDIKENEEDIDEENQINDDESFNEKNINPKKKNNNSNMKKKELEKLNQSPAFSKENNNNLISNNGIEFNKDNNYSFKNSVKVSKNNFNQSSKLRNNSNQKPKNNFLNLITKRERKISNKNGKAKRHKKLNNNKEGSDDDIGSENNNKKYISFNDNYEENENDSENNDNENILDISNASFLPDEEIQKVCQTLSDINETNMEKNNANNYMTFPFEYKNDNINLVIKEIPFSVKRGISININKIEKEKNIRKVSTLDDDIPSLKELEKQIIQIKKEVKQIYINDYYNEKITKLHFQELDDEDEINNKLLKMADDLNIDFYKDIEDKLDMAKEKLNSLMP